MSEQDSSSGEKQEAWCDTTDGWLPQTEAQRFLRTNGDWSAWVVELEFEGPWKTWFWHTYQRKADGRWSIWASGYTATAQQAKDAADRSMRLAPAVTGGEVVVKVERIEKKTRAAKKR